MTKSEAGDRKYILVLRHGTQDSFGPGLTAASRQSCAHLKTKLPHFDQVISSPVPRAVETAHLLTGINPTQIQALSFPPPPPGFSEYVTEKRQTHPLGAPGAIFEDADARVRFRAQAELWLTLIKQTFDNLPASGQALMVSHDGMMVALEKLINDDSDTPARHTFLELSGFWLDPQLNILEFQS